MRRTFRQIIVFHSHPCGDALCVYKVSLVTHSLEAILRLKFYHCCQGGSFFFIVDVHYRSDETTCSFSLRGWGKALYCSGERQLSFSSTEKRHERLMEGENCWDWKCISFIFVFYFALNNFMLDILLKMFFFYMQNWRYNMLAWKNLKTSGDTRRRASAALKPWWYEEELHSGSVCSWKDGPSIPRRTLWDSNSH